MIELLTRRRAPPATPPAPRVIDGLAGPLDPVAALLFQDPSAGRLVVDRHGRILRASDALRRLLGPTADLAPGAPLTGLLAPEDRESAWRELAPVLRGHAISAPARVLSLRLVGPLGEALTVSVTAAPVREADGTASGTLLAVQDMSQQARLEAQLAHSQRLQAAGQLAGGIAHDFNNLLTAVIGGADALAGRCAEDAEAEAEVALIRAGAERGAALVRKLLAFGRQQTLQPRPLAINDVIAEISAVLRRLLGGGVRLEAALEEPGRWVRADPTALDQVLVNLAVNARDAMSQGGVLTLRTGHVTLFRPLLRGPETVPPGRYVMIEVQDTGVGIAPEVLGRIFEPFFTTKRDRGGSGLGLAVVHGIVRQSDGFLGVESEVGRGTRVRVYLPEWDAGEVTIPPTPAETAPPPPPPPAAAHAPVPAARGTVLLVEDEPSVRRIAARALGRQGWTVLEAESAEEALDMMSREPRRVAAVVSDLLLPGQDGAQLVRALRHRLGMPRLPAILASGYAAEDVRGEVAEALGEAGTRFLAKPYDMRDLGALLLALTAEAAAGG
jgi:two-component system, cell cycle sensor histidine kinase and response regulator CckA